LSCRNAGFLCELVPCLGKPARKRVVTLGKSVAECRPVRLLQQEDQTVFPGYPHDQGYDMVCARVITGT
jgi:hypothetical protein